MSELEIQTSQGANLSHILVIKNTSTNTVINIASYSFEAMLRHSFISANGTSITCTKTDSTNGVLTLSLSATTTGSLDYGTYVFDVLGTVDNFTSRYYNGLIVIRPGVSYGS